MTQVKSKVICDRRGRFYVVVDGVKVAKRGHPDFDPKAPLPIDVLVAMATTWISLKPGYQVHEDDDGNVVTYQGALAH